MVSPTLAASGLPSPDGPILYPVTSIVFRCACKGGTEIVVAGRFCVGSEDRWSQHAHTGDDGLKKANARCMYVFLFPLDCRLRGPAARPRRCPDHFTPHRGATQHVFFCI